VDDRPHVEFRGRNHLGSDPRAHLHVPDYVNAYSDLDSGDDTRNEPSEDERLLPAYPPALLEEEREGEEENVDGEEEEEMGVGNVSERSALNFVPGLTNLSGRSHDDSYRAKRSSEV
jgi:hypothetical protein